LLNTGTSRGDVKAVTGGKEKKKNTNTKHTHRAKLICLSSVIKFSPKESFLKKRIIIAYAW